MERSRLPMFRWRSKSKSPAGSGRVSSAPEAGQNNSAHSMAEPSAHDKGPRSKSCSSPAVATNIADTPVSMKSVRGVPSVAKIRQVGKSDLLDKAQNSGSEPKNVIVQSTPEHRVKQQQSEVCSTTDPAPRVTAAKDNSSLLDEDISIQRPIKPHPECPSVNSDSSTSPHHDYVELDYTGTGFYEECIPSPDYQELNILSSSSLNTSPRSTTYTSPRNSAGTFDAYSKLGEDVADRQTVPPTGTCPEGTCQCACCADINNALSEGEEGVDTDSDSGSGCDHGKRRSQAGAETGIPGKGPKMQVEDEQEISRVDMEHLPNSQDYASHRNEKDYEDIVHHHHPDSKDSEATRRSVVSNDTFQSLQSDNSGEIPTPSLSATSEFKSAETQSEYMTQTTRSESEFCGTPAARPKSQQYTDSFPRRGYLCASDTETCGSLDSKATRANGMGYKDLRVCIPEPSVSSGRRSPFSPPHSAPPHNMSMDSIPEVSETADPEELSSKLLPGLLSPTYRGSFPRLSSPRRPSCGVRMVELRAGIRHSQESPCGSVSSDFTSRESLTSNSPRNSTRRDSPMWDSSSNVNDSLNSSNSKSSIHESVNEYQHTLDCSNSNSPRMTRQDQYYRQTSSPLMNITTPPHMSTDNATSSLPQNWSVTGETKLSKPLWVPQISRSISDDPRLIQRSQQQLPSDSTKLHKHIRKSWEETPHANKGSRNKLQKDNSRNKPDHTHTAGHPDNGASTSMAKEPVSGIWIHKSKIVSTKDVNKERPKKGHKPIQYTSRSARSSESYGTPVSGVSQATPVTTSVPYTTSCMNMGVSHSTPLGYVSPTSVSGYGRSQEQLSRHSSPEISTHSPTTTTWTTSVNKSRSGIATHRCLDSVYEHIYEEPANLMSPENCEDLGAGLCSATDTMKRSQSTLSYDSLPSQTNTLTKSCSSPSQLKTNEFGTPSPPSPNKPSRQSPTRSVQRRDNFGKRQLPETPRSKNIQSRQLPEVPKKDFSNSIESIATSDTSEYDQSVTSNASTCERLKYSEGKTSKSSKSPVADLIHSKLGMMFHRKKSSLVKCKAASRNDNVPAQSTSTDETASKGGDSPGYSGNAATRFAYGSDAFSRRALRTGQSKGTKSSKAEHQEAVSGSVTDSTDSSVRSQSQSPEPSGSLLQKQKMSKLIPRSPIASNIAADITKSKSGYYDVRTGSGDTMAELDDLKTTAKSKCLGARNLSPSGKVPGSYRGNPVQKGKKGTGLSRPRPVLNSNIPEVVETTECGSSRRIPEPLSLKDHSSYGITPKQPGPDSPSKINRSPKQIPSPSMKFQQRFCFPPQLGNKNAQIKENSEGSNTDKNAAAVLKYNKSVQNKHRSQDSQSDNKTNKESKSSSVNRKKVMEKGMAVQKSANVATSLDCDETEQTKPSKLSKVKVGVGTQTDPILNQPRILRQPKPKHSVGFGQCSEQSKGLAIPKCTSPSIQTMPNEINFSTELRGASRNNIPSSGEEGKLSNVDSAPKESVAQPEKNVELSTDNKNKDNSPSQPKLVRPYASSGRAHNFLSKFGFGGKAPKQANLAHGQDVLDHMRNFNGEHTDDKTVPFIDHASAHGANTNARTDDFNVSENNTSDNDRVTEVAPVHLDHFDMVSDDANGAITTGRPGFVERVDIDNQDDNDVYEVQCYEHPPPKSEYQLLNAKSELKAINDHHHDDYQCLDMELSGSNNNNSKRKKHDYTRLRSQQAVQDATSAGDPQKEDYSYDQLNVSRSTSYNLMTDCPNQEKSSEIGYSLAGPDHGESSEESESTYQCLGSETSNVTQIEAEGDSECKEYEKVLVYNQNNSSQKPEKFEDENIYHKLDLQNTVTAKEQTDPSNNQENKEAVDVPSPVNELHAEQSLLVSSNKRESPENVKEIAQDENHKSWDSAGKDVSNYRDVSPKDIVSDVHSLHNTVSQDNTTRPQGATLGEVTCNFALEDHHSQPLVTFSKHFAELPTENMDDQLAQMTSCWPAMSDYRSLNKSKVPAADRMHCGSLDRRKVSLAGKHPWGMPSLCSDEGNLADCDFGETGHGHEIWETFHSGLTQGVSLSSGADQGTFGNLRLSESGYDSWKSHDSSSTVHGSRDTIKCMKTNQMSECSYLLQNLDDKCGDVADESDLLAWHDKDSDDTTTVSTVSLSSQQDHAVSMRDTDDISSLSLPSNHEYQSQENISNKDDEKGHNSNQYLRNKTSSEKTLNQSTSSLNSLELENAEQNESNIFMPHDNKSDHCIKENQAINETEATSMGSQGKPIANTGAKATNEEQNWQHSKTKVSGASELPASAHNGAGDKSSDPLFAVKEGTNANAKNSSETVYLHAMEKKCIAHEKHHNTASSPPKCYKIGDKAIKNLPLDTEPANRINGHTEGTYFLESEEAVASETPSKRDNVPSQGHSKILSRPGDGSKIDGPCLKNEDPIISDKCFTKRNDAVVSPEEINSQQANVTQRNTMSQGETSQSYIPNNPAQVEDGSGENLHDCTELQGDTIVGTTSKKENGVGGEYRVIDTQVGDDTANHACTSVEERCVSSDIHSSFECKSLNSDNSKSVIVKNCPKQNIGEGTKCLYDETFNGNEHHQVAAQNSNNQGSGHKLDDTDEQTTKPLGIQTCAENSNLPCEIPRNPPAPITIKAADSNNSHQNSTNVQKQSISPDGNTNTSISPVPEISSSNVNNMPLYLKPDSPSTQRSNSSPLLLNSKSQAHEVSLNIMSGEQVLKRSKAVSQLNVENEESERSADGQVVLTETAVSESSLHVSDEDHKTTTQKSPGSCGNEQMQEGQFPHRNSGLLMLNFGKQFKDISNVIEDHRDVGATSGSSQDIPSDVKYPSKSPSPEINKSKITPPGHSSARSKLAKSRQFFENPSGTPSEIDGSNNARTKTQRVHGKLNSKTPSPEKVTQPSIPARDRSRIPSGTVYSKSVAKKPQHIPQRQRSEEPKTADPEQPASPGPSRQLSDEGKYGLKKHLSSKNINNNSGGPIGKRGDKTLDQNLSGKNQSRSTSLKSLVHQFEAGTQTPDRHERSSPQREKNLSPDPIPEKKSSRSVILAPGQGRTPLGVQRLSGSAAQNMESRARFFSQSNSSSRSPATPLKPGNLQATHAKKDNPSANPGATAGEGADQQPIREGGVTNKTKPVPNTDGSSPRPSIQRPRKPSQSRLPSYKQ